jgi:cell division protease FtsH
MFDKSESNYMDSNSKKKPPINKNKPGNDNQQKPNNDFDWGKIIRTVFSWGAVIIAAVILMQFWKGGNTKAPKIEFYTYQKFLDGNKIASAKIIKTDINDYTFKGTLKKKEFINKTYIKKFTVTMPGPIITQQVKLWQKKDIKYSFVKESNAWMSILINILPWILIIGVWLFFMKRMQGGAGGTKGIFSFGKSRAKLISESAVKVTFKDVAGADEAKQELEEIIEFLKEPTKFQKLGGKIPKGVLLLGPPGTGKTLLARAVSGEAGVPFYSISGADFVEMFVGVGASRVRDLFEQGKKNAPCIIFIDEIDAVGRHRGAGLGGGHDEREQTLNALLVEMDGFEKNNGVIIIAATNRPDVLDPALLRPGRFDRQVVVDRPDVNGREGIFKVHTRKIPLDDNVDLKVLAKGTPGLAGADIANLVNEAALLAARKNRKKVTMDDFEEAKDKVMMGMERKSMIISEEEKKVTAYHEAGHVLVARKLPESDPVHKVTIIPRGRALGVTHYLPMGEKHTYTKTYIETNITTLLGGRAAELLIFNQLTTGAGNDIERATELAHNMVCKWGMSEKLGPLSFGQNEEEIFLGREITKHKNVSDLTAQRIDEEISNIVEAAMKRAQKILKDNEKVLHNLADELLEREILDANEIDKILNGEQLPPLQKMSDTEQKDTITDNVPEHVKMLLDKKKEREEKIQADKANDGN